jgi:hypothetical protein
MTCARAAERAEQCGVLRRVPERVCREDDVGAYAGGGGGLDGRGRVGAPGVRDDGAVRAGVVARYVRFTSGKSLANENAQQAGARAEFYQGQGMRIGGGGPTFCRGEIELGDVICNIGLGGPDGGDMKSDQCSVWVSGTDAVIISGGELDAQSVCEEPACG